MTIDLPGLPDGFTAQLVRRIDLQGEPYQLTVMGDHPYKSSEFRGIGGAQQLEIHALIESADVPVSLVEDIARRIKEATRQEYLPCV